MRDTLNAFFAGLFYVFILIATAALVTGYPIKWLWNWLMPMIFGLTTITFWQAVGLALLSGMLLTKTQATTKSE